MNELDISKRYGYNYQLVDVDDSFGFPHYYGYVLWNGGFYIMKESSTGSLSYARYEFGSRGRYSQAWVNRISLTYLPWDGSF